MQAKCYVDFREAIRAAGVLPRLTPLCADADSASRKFASFAVGDNDNHTMIIVILMIMIIIMIMTMMMMMMIVIIILMIIRILVY